MTPRKFTLPLDVCICREPNCQIPFGECHCGCGGKTKIADRTCHKIGWVEGRPTRFIIGHANRIPRLDFSDAMPFKIEGVYCKLLGLTKGMCAIVDAGVYEEMKARRYYATKTKYGFYAVRHSKGYKKEMGPFLYLHRELLGLPVGEPTQGDHDNGCTLDCRMKNLRPATQIQNHQNCKSHRDNTSGRTGVHFRKDRNSFVAQIRCNGKYYRKGGFKTFEEAVKYRGGYQASIWMNPPYGREIVLWMKKAYETSGSGVRVVALVPNRSNAPWWHEYVMKAREIRFIRKKVPFSGPIKGVPFWGSCLVVFGPGICFDPPSVSSYDQPPTR